MYFLRSQPPLLSTLCLATVLILSSHAHCDAGGSGVVHNGPTFEIEMIPLLVSQGVSVEELGNAVDLCLLKGDSHQGLISLAQRLYFNLFGVWPSPDRSKSEFRLMIDQHMGETKNFNIGLDYAYFEFEDHQLIFNTYGLKNDRLLISIPDFKQIGLIESDWKIDSSFPVFQFNIYTSDKTTYAVTHSDKVFDITINNGTHYSDIPKLISFGKNSPIKIFIDLNDYVSCLRNSIRETENEKSLRKLHSFFDPSDTQCPKTTLLCDELEAWLSVKEIPFYKTAPQNMDVRIIEQELERVSRKGAIERIYSSYLKEEDFTCRSREILKCLNGRPGSGNLIYSFTDYFIEKTLSSLEKRKNDRIDLLINQVNLRYQMGLLSPLIHLTGLFGQDSPTPEKAGVNRGTGSIFLDLLRVKPHELELIFLHEMIHSIDPRPRHAEEWLFQKDGIEELKRLRHESITQKSLSDFDDVLLEQWLQNGLQRGLWAEWVAWKGTFDIYRDLRASQELNPIPWLEEVLQHYHKCYDSENPNSFDIFLYEYLKSKAKKPSLKGEQEADDLFSTPVIARKLKEILESGLAGIFHYAGYCSDYYNSFLCIKRRSFQTDPSNWPPSEKSSSRCTYEY